jgi:hypothetical protein
MNSNKGRSSMHKVQTVMYSLLAYSCMNLLYFSLLVSQKIVVNIFMQASTDLNAADGLIARTTWPIYNNKQAL